VTQRGTIEEGVVETEGLRVDRWAAEHFVRLPSRAAARKAAKRGDLQLNGAPVESSRFVRVGDVVTLALDDVVLPPNRLTPEVVFADEHLAVVVKPPGLLTNGARLRTLERALPNVLRRSSLPDALAAPRPVHRLDYETTGLVVVARTEGAMVALGRAFQQREVHKTYRALVAGRLEEDRVIEVPLDGRDARSEVVVLGHTRSLKVDWSTELTLHPVTGRMHQLRRHLSGIGHAILGDRRYPSGSVLRKHGLFLAAVGLSLRHPTTGEPLALTMPVPPKFGVFQARERRRWARHHGDGSSSTSASST